MESTVTCCIEDTEINHPQSQNNLCLFGHVTTVLFLNRAGK